MKSALPLLLLGFFLLPTLNTNAANRFWVSSAASNWNNTANWSNTSGGPGGFSVPTAADNVTFNNARVGNCTIDAPVNIQNITVTGGYTGRIIQGGNTVLITNNASFSGGIFAGGTAGITINGDFTLNGTAFTATSGILDFDGNVAFTSGVFTHNNGSVRFNAAGGTAVTGNSPTFYILEFVGNGFNYNINSTGNIIVLNSLNMTGNLFYNLNTGTIDVRGNISVTNTAPGCGGTALININGTVNQNFTGSSVAGLGALPRLTINKSSGTLNLSNFPASSNDYTYTAGTVNAGTSTYCFVDGTTTPYTISGNLALNNVEFLAITNQTYTVPATTTITVNGDMTMAGTNRITLNTGNINVNGNIVLTNTSAAGGGTANINIVGTGNVSLDGTAVAINQNLLPFINISKTGGALTLKGIISVTRSWTYSSGLVDASSFASTVVFGGNALNISSNGMSFHNLTVRANTVSLLNSLTLNNALVITGGRLAPGANQINIAGNWTDYGTAGFTEATSTVSFNGSALQTIVSPGGENFVNLTINNTGAGIQLNNNAVVATTFRMTQGNFNLNGNILTLGLSAANNGTLIYTAGMLYGSGSFTRWFKTGVIPNGSVNGLFPMGTTINNRPFFVSAPVAGPTTGGTITVSYNDATTNTYTPTYPDGAFTIMVRKDLNWAVSTANGLAGGTYNLDVQGTGFGLIGAVSDLRLTLSNSVVGSPGVNAGTTSDPQINRTGLTRANLTNTFYVGSVNLVSTPLPITLISFTASVRNKQVMLNWVTVAEINNDHFTIQRSKDGEEWESLQRIPGGGTSSTEKFYQATDASPYSGISYYRLKQTDIDGKTSYSNIVLVKLAETNTEIQVFPNPSTDFINIKFPENGKYEVALLNSSGQFMVNPVTAAGTEIRLNVSKMRTGVYFLQISHEGQLEVRKIVISR
jgi:Secretion system C-terminal sorting domain